MCHNLYLCRRNIPLEYWICLSTGLLVGRALDFHLCHSCYADSSPELGPMHSYCRTSLVRLFRRFIKITSMYKKRISQYKTSLPSKSPPELIQNAPPQSPPPRPLPFSSFPPARPPTFSLQPRPQTLNALSPPTPSLPNNPPRTPPPRPPSRPHLCPPRHAHRPSNNGAYHTSR